MEEKPKNKKNRLLNNAILFFILLTILVMIVSIIGSHFGWQATYSRVNAITGDLEQYVVSITNVFNGEGLRYIIGNCVTNFVTFAPVGLLIIALIGIGVAYKSGFLPTLFNIIGKKFNKFWLTFLVAFLSILSNFIGDFNYVIMLPLAAIFFLANNRNPIIGILISFVSITAGQGINLFISGFDYDLLSYTQQAANLIDKEININLYANLFVGIVGSVALAFLITYVTEKIMVGRIPKYKRDELVTEDIVITKKERRGLILASFGTILILLIYLYMLIPDLPFSGLLLDKAGGSYFNKLFGIDSYFEISIAYFITLILCASGLLYGFGARTVKNREDVSSVFYKSLDDVGGILVLLFFASQFIAIFKRTNIGNVITAGLVQIMDSLNFSAFPLMILLFILVAIANLFLISPVTKWAIISPVIIPLFMEANITPEFSQAIYRLSDSATSILTPLLPFFVIFIGFVELYNQDSKSVEIRQCYKMLWPYALAITLLWLFVIFAWYIIGLPIGINGMPTV